jgi:PAS domain S-box-containing protein
MLRSTTLRFVFAAASVLLVFVIKDPLDEWFGSGPPLIFFVPAVTFSAWVGGLWPGLVATALTTILCTYYFFPPIGSFELHYPNDRLRLSVFVLDGILTSVLMGQLHAARRRSEEDRLAAERYKDTLARSEEQLQAIMDNSTAMIYLKDLKGKILVVNKHFESVFHVSREAIVGKNVGDAFPNNIAQILRARDRSVLSDGKSLEYEEVVPQEDGEHTYVSLRFPLLDARGTLYAIGGISTDITPLKDAQQRALQAGRLAAIGQMVTGLAHESRNALQRIQVCLELLGLRLKDRPQALDLVHGIQDAQDDLHRLFEEVRDYAAPIILDRRTCRLSDLLHEAWDRLETNRTGRDARLHERRSTNGDADAHADADTDADGSCAVDRFRMIQVFRNILDNALAACRDPVEIDVDWSETTINGAPAVAIAIRDNGPGFSADQRQKLFEPFYTTKTQGTGLGLAIVKRIIEAHDGVIEVEPDQNQGQGQNPNQRRGASLLITLPRGTR